MMLPGVLQQDQIWVNGERLEEMDRHHRANLIPFLRGNVCALYGVHHGVPSEAFTDAEAEEWLAATPLMCRLVELEAGRPIDERRETFERNQTFEALTGYQKVRFG